MPVCAFNSLLNRKYSNLFIVAAFYTKSVYGRTSLPGKNLYQPTFTGDKADIFAVCLSKSH